MSDPLEADWIATFSRWRTAMQRATKDSPTYLAPSTDAAWILAIIRSVGEVQWVVHDRKAGMAAAVDASSVKNVPRKIEESLGLLRAELARDGNIEARSVAVSGIVVEKPGLDEWVLGYRLVPMAGVMVNGKDLGGV